MVVSPVQLIDTQGSPLPDKVLLEPRADGLMHPAVAVANLLRIWALANPAQCLAALPEVVRVGKLVLQPDGFCRLAIDGRQFQVASITTRDGATKPERVLSGARPGQPHEENYWILNPGAAGDERLAVRIRRKKLADLADTVNCLAENSDNSAIAGMSIRLG